MTSGGNNFNSFPENRTSLTLHFLPYEKKFQSPKGGGHGPSGPMVNTPMGVGKIVDFRHLSRRISETVQDRVGLQVDDHYDH